MPRLKTRQIALEAELKRIKKSAKDGPLDEGRLQEIVRDLDEVNGALRKSVALIVGNGTTTGLGNELSRVEDETLWVYSAEGGHVVDVMLGSTGKHAPHIELWLNGFSGESYNQTRGRSSAGGANCVLLKSVCLSSLLMVQPVVAQKLIDHKLARERGLLARLLIVEIKTRPRRDDGMVTAVSERARRNGASEIVSLREEFWVGITNQRHEKQKTNTQCRVQGASGLGCDQRH
jgi:hypothetical protein